MTTTTVFDPIEERETDKTPMLSFGTRIELAVAMRKRLEFLIERWVNHESARDYWAAGIRACLDARYEFDKAPIR